MQFILVSNGPGEVAGWVRPISAALRQKYPDSNIELFLVPCQFRSGDEKKMAESFGTLNQVYTPQEYFKFLKKPLQNAPTEGVILGLGGDIKHTEMLKWKLKLPAYLYSESLTEHKSFEYVFNVARDGNLMADFERAPDVNLKDLINEKKISFFPGSRKRFIKSLIPFYKKTILEIHKRDPQVKAQWFLPSHLKNDLMKKYELNESQVLPQINDTALMVTIIGTNNVEFAVNRIPMLVWLPYNWPGLIPLPGLFGLLSQIPLFGLIFKMIAIIVDTLFPRNLSWPNRQGQKNLVPEIHGYLKPAQLARLILKELHHPDYLLKQSEQLNGLFGSKGIADRIVSRLK